MKANYVVFSDGAESMAYLDQERGVILTCIVSSGAASRLWRLKKVWMEFFQCTRSYKP